jgi:hypothetical protein
VERRGVRSAQALMPSAAINQQTVPSWRAWAGKMQVQHGEQDG